MNPVIPGNFVLPVSLPLTVIVAIAADATKHCLKEEGFIDTAVEQAACLALPCFVLHLF